MKREKRPTSHASRRHAGRQLKIQKILRSKRFFVVLLFYYFIAGFFPTRASANCAFNCCPSLDLCQTYYPAMSCDDVGYKGYYCCDSCTADKETPQDGIVNPVIPGLRGDYGAKLGGIISGIMGFLLTLAGILSFFYLLTGGIQWITSGGDKAGVETARQKILNAVIGLIITFGTWAIMKVIFEFLGIDFPNFSLPKLV